MIERQLSLGQHLVNSSSEGNWPRIWRDPSVHFAIGNGYVPRSAFLNQHGVSNDLIEHTTQDLIALLGGDGTTCPRLEVLHCAIEIGFGHGFAVDACHDIGNLRRHWLRRGAGAVVACEPAAAPAGAGPAASVDDLEQPQMTNATIKVRTRIREISLGKWCVKRRGGVFTAYDGLPGGSTQHVIVEVRTLCEVRVRGQVAQLVEHVTENHGVAGSIPALATDFAQ